LLTTAAPLSVPQVQECFDPRNKSEGRRAQHRVGARGHTLSLTKGIAARYTRSKITAMPWPTPMHMETSA
jgi:hypothetical protein